MAPIPDMIIELWKTNKANPDGLGEGETDRKLRQRMLRAKDKKIRRQVKLDRYFSLHPPNGRSPDILAGAIRKLIKVQWYEDPKKIYLFESESKRCWVSWPACVSSFDRLTKKGVLTVHTTEDSIGRTTYNSTSTVKQRNVASVQQTAIIGKFQADIKNQLQLPPIPIESVPDVVMASHVNVNRYRVRWYVGRKVQTLGTYDFETAVRLQDAVSYFFSSYRRISKYNLSESEAKSLIESNVVVKKFMTDLEALWKGLGWLDEAGSSPEQIITELTHQVDVLNQKAIEYKNEKDVLNFRIAQLEKKVFQLPDKVSIVLS